MFQKPKVPDRQIQQKVSAQLPRRGIRPPCDVRVSVHNGTVTLSGKLEFDLQRKAAVHAASGVNGVQRVVDQMAVMHSTIGGWHAKSPGAQLKHTATMQHAEPSPQSAGETSPHSAAPATTPPAAAPQAESKE